MSLPDVDTHQQQQRGRRGRQVGDETFRIRHILLTELRDTMRAIKAVSRREILKLQDWELLRDLVEKLFDIFESYVLTLTSTTTVENVVKLVRDVRQYIDKIFNVKKSILTAIEKRDLATLRVELVELETLLDKFRMLLEVTFVTRARVGESAVSIVATPVGVTTVGEVEAPELSEDAKRLLTLLLTHGELPLSRIRNIFGRRADAIVDELVRFGYAEKIFDTCLMEEKLVPRVEFEI